MHLGLSHNVYFSPVFPIWVKAPHEPTTVAMVTRRRLCGLLTWTCSVHWMRETGLLEPRSCFPKHGHFSGYKVWVFRYFAHKNFMPDTTSLFKWPTRGEKKCNIEAENDRGSRKLALLSLNSSNYKHFSQQCPDPWKTRVVPYLGIRGNQNTLRWMFRNSESYW